jgi:hypothetical protein
MLTSTKCGWRFIFLVRSLGQRELQIGRRTGLVKHSMIPALRARQMDHPRGGMGARLVLPHKTKIASAPSPKTTGSDMNSALDV